MAEGSNGDRAAGTSRGLVDVDAALASEAFDAFCAANTMRQIIGLYRRICTLIGVRPSRLPDFYPKLRDKLTSNSWRAQAVLKKIDLRANQRVYNGGKACLNTKVLIVGAGPCGLRCAIECQLLGAKVVIIEKRESMSRNNVLHLWPFVIHDLKALGAKKFFGKFCAGSIDHISIRQLQYILLKIALLTGIEFHEGCSFEELLEPETTDGTEKMGWRARVTPADHAVSHYEFDVLIRADGKRDTVEGFKRNCLRAKLAIAITTNFIYRHTEHEASVPEISGISSIFNQKFFKDFYRDTGIDLENIVYYKGDTHYFVMTAKKTSLLDKGVLMKDHADTQSLLSKENVNQEALMSYAREAAAYATKGSLPNLEFAVNHYGLPDVAIFDFTSMFATENACKTLERGGHRLLVCLTGDSLLEPFWPTGSGCARGFLSSLDAGWAVRTLASGVHPLAVMAERESIYRLLGQTTPENLHRNIAGYTLDPATRYPNLNRTAVAPHQVTAYYDTDDPNAKSSETIKSLTNLSAISQPAKKKKRDTLIEPNALLSWLKKQVGAYSIVIDNLKMAIKDGLVLCAVIHRYRPDLLDYDSLDPMELENNNDLAFRIFEEHFNIPSVITGREVVESDSLDVMIVYKYLLQIYYAFKGEIPFTGMPEYDLSEFDKDSKPARDNFNLSPHNFKTKALKPHNIDLNISKLKRKRKSNSPKCSTGLSTDRERGIGVLPSSKKGMPEEFSKRIKSINDKFQANVTPTHKKPKDLMRAIGKIEKTDWNVREIENKIRENKMGKSPAHGGEKVPKWNREQFLARQSKLQKHGLEKQDSCEGKFKQIDNSLKNLDKILKEGSTREIGERGYNKVANLADKFSKIAKPGPDEKQTQPAPLKRAKTITTVEYTPKCHICKKPVYIVERVTSENHVFHKSCFRCHYCLASLRVGFSVTVNEKLYCPQHASIQPHYEKPSKPLPTTLMDLDLLDRSPRIQMTAPSPRTDSPPCAVMDEDEWRDRNFGNSSFYSCSSASSSSSDDDDDEDNDEKYSRIDSRSNFPYYDNVSGEESEDDYSDNSDEFSYHEYSSGDDSGSATECSEERLARERRRQEVALKPAPPVVDDTATETETPTSDETEKSSEAANSATEVSTDSEFAHDDPTPTRELPSICINDKFVTVVRGSKCVRNKAKYDKNKPSAAVNDNPVCKVEIKSGIICNPKVNRDNVRTKLADNATSNINTIQDNTQAAPKMTDYLLSRTQSTSGIATKRALELKKKYLLGPLPMLSIQKSDSASQLDSKFKSFHSNISECQKLLNPAPDISPSMQAFLMNTSKRVAPLSPSNPAIVSDSDGLQYFSAFKQERKKPEDLNLSNKNLPDVIQNTFSCFTNKLDNQVGNSKFEELKTPINETSARTPTKNDIKLKNASPDKETVIPVPKIKWEEDKNKKGAGTATETDMDSDSLSGLGSSTDEDSSKQASQSVAVPRVEIHNTSGELMQLDSLMIVNGQYIGPLNSDEDCEENPNSPNTQQKKSSDSNNVPPKVVKIGDNSAANSESGNDITTLALTETELSDWAVDGAVSDNFDDVEFKITPDKNNTQRLKKPKSVPKLKSPTPRKVDGLSHVEHICGKPLIVKIPDPKKNMALAMEDFDFMDTGSEDSLIETLASTTNKILLKNRGFMEVVDNPEPQNNFFFTHNTNFNETSHRITNRELESPTNDRSINFIEQGACILENLETNYDINRKKEPMVHLKDNSYFNSEVINKSALESNSNNSQVDVIENDNTPCNYSGNTLENHNETHNKTLDCIMDHEFIPKPVVEITPVSMTIIDNVEDYLNSSRQPKLTDTKDTVEANNPKDSRKNISNFSPKSPSTAKRLLEISIDKVKQKDLIHELVMDRLAAKRLPNVEKRSTRRSRNNTNDTLNKSDDAPSVDNMNISKASESFNSNNNTVVSMDNSLITRENILSPNTTNKSTSSCGSQTNIVQETSRTSDPSLNIGNIHSPKKPLTSFHTSFRIKPVDAIYKSNTETSLKSSSATLMFNDNQLPLVAKLNQKGEFILRPRVLSDATDHKHWKSQNLAKTYRNSTDASHPTTEYKPLAVKDGHGCIMKGKKLYSTEEAIVHKPSNELSLSDPELMRSTRKQKALTRDKERRKSIIQTVSSFFNKRLSPKHKEKSKSCYGLDATCVDENEMISSVPKKSISECELNSGHVLKCFYKSEPLADQLKRTPSHSGVRHANDIIIGKDVYSHRNSKHDNKGMLQERSQIHFPEIHPPCSNCGKLDDVLDDSSQESLLTREEISARIEKTDMCIKLLEKGLTGLEDLISQSSNSPNIDEKVLLTDWFNQRRRLSAARRVQRDMASRIADMRLQNRHLRLRRRLRHILNGQAFNHPQPDSPISENDNAFEESAIITEIVQIKAQRQSLASLRHQDKKSGSTVDSNDIQRRISNGALNFKELQKMLPQ